MPGVVENTIKFEATDTIGFGDNTGKLGLSEFTELIRKLSLGLDIAFYVLNVMNTRLAKEDVKGIQYLREIFKDDFKNTYIILTQFENLHPRKVEETRRKWFNEVCSVLKENDIEFP